MIMIVDDDREMGASLERMLRYSGLNSLAIPSGMEALSLLSLRRPELMIVDLRMPGLDGIALISAVRKDPEFKDVPIIMYTATFSEATQREAIAAGAQEYIVKGTIGWESLINRVKKYLPDKK